MKSKMYVYYCVCQILLTISMTAMNDKTKALMARIPREVYALIDPSSNPNAQPSITGTRILTAQEQQYNNLPFWREQRHSSKHWVKLLYINPNTKIRQRMCQFQDPFQNAVYRYVGPFKIDNRELCIVHDGERRELMALGQNLETYCNLEHNLFVKSEQGEYVFDSDYDTGTIYTAQNNGAIFSYLYSKISGKSVRKQVQPPLSEEIQKKLEKATTIKHRYPFLVQFDHKLPDMLLVCIDQTKVLHLMLVHRPKQRTEQYTQYIQHREDPVLTYPLLDNGSFDRLRILSRVPIEIVSVARNPILLYIMGSVVYAAQLFYSHLKTDQKNRCTVHDAQRIMNIFKREISEPSDRYFFVWQSQNSDGTYALKEVYTWLKEQTLLQ